MNNADAFTQMINVYTKIFSSYFQQFLSWGQWLFYSFSIIAIVWLCLWRAFEKDSVVESMPGFLKEFFTIALFYTFMVHAAPWLSSLVETTQTMGQQLTHQQVDPASIIHQGVTIANKIFYPVKNSGITAYELGNVIIAAAYLITLFSFIAVALNLAVTWLLTTFFISLSGLLLAFGTFPLTRNIARRTLDTVIAQSFKLLALYLVIGAGSGTLTTIAGYLPSDKITTFDVYAWTAAAALLFWCVAATLPKQAAALFRNAIEENRASESASKPILSPAMTAIRSDLTSPPTSVLLNTTFHQIEHPIMKSKPFRGES